MAEYHAPLTDMNFLLQEVFAAEQTFAVMPDTAEVSADLMEAILTEAGKIAQDVLAPINQNGDEESCQLVDGIVTTPKGFKEAFATFVGGGWQGLTGDVEFGGQGMPKMLSALIEEMLFGSNSSFALYSILTTGAALTLSRHGNAELKQTYLPKLYAGQWCGSMCLTEPHAGTDLGLIRSRADAQPDGSYTITGTKIFITSGEHDLAENIIHLVLARMPDAVAGSRGISLFLVPKMLHDDEGNLTGERNQLDCGSIEHKMGIKGSATCVLNFDGAKGYLVGEPNAGLANMFTMMNYERLSMGQQGNGLAESSYQLAAAYAKDRLQGRSPVKDDKQNAANAADPIIVHPDVRRMLLTMRANIMAGRALSLYAASQLDIMQFHPDATAREKAEQLIALLVPVQKAYCTDRGFEACVLGQQVLGGHGYISEWGLEQNVRDARIAQIYEGTNGVQALDLAGRKTVRCNGTLLKLLIQEWDAFITSDQAKPLSNFKHHEPIWREARDHLQQATKWLIQHSKTQPDEVGAASYPYMELMGLNLYAFMWLKILSAALNPNTIRYDTNYCDGLIKTAEFFFARLLPRSTSLLQEIQAGSDTLMALKAEQF
ncbi:MAG: acyl-CoA dehydrogenase C-terminal domain-containing protein [Pseudohongiellaceae bacterium]